MKTKSIILNSRLFLPLLLGIAIHNPAARANNFVVQFDNTLHFTPPVINVNVGDTITWSNASSGLPHTVTGTGAEAMCGASTFTTVGAGCSHTFTNAGSFAYHCNFHFSFGMTGLVNVASVIVPPTVALTIPSNGTVFAAPANVTLSASAGPPASVTNVTFFAGTNVLGSVTTAPFTLIANNLSAASYSLTAVASAGGLSTTSAVVNITVVTPVPITLSSPAFTNGQFSFQYTANPGLSYVVQNSPDLSTWSPISTNVAAGNPAPFTDSTNSSSLLFYRVGLRPNP